KEEAPPPPRPLSAPRSARVHALCASDGQRLLIGGFSGSDGFGISPAATQNRAAVCGAWCAVVYNVGLCICLFDITKLEDAYVFPGDGASHTKVHFRYVVFHPFLDEILIGKIKGCSPEGVHVSLGFFDDILIPPESLQQPAKFDEAEQVWVWEYETEEGAHDLYMDTGEEIRFRVVDESFVDTSPTGPSSADATTSSEELPKKEAPYTLVVSFTAVMDPTVAVAVGPPLTLTEKTLPGP
uniref:DNA-directed RNA polymerase subunit n=1 Tax=Macaca fascicularis TaxID=9541 RepID=A0A7N9D2B6_MACFA